MARPDDPTTRIPTDEYVTVGQIKTRFWLQGEGSTVILIHGFAGSVEHWSPTIPRLAEHHRVFAVDLMGAGRTDKPPVPLSFSHLARFVRDFMDAQGIENASLIGHSMGGGVALEFAIHWPDRLEKLVLVDSAGLDRQLRPDFRVCTLPIAGWLLTRTTPKRTADFLRKCVYDPSLVTDDLVHTFCELGALPGAHAAMLSMLRSNAGLWGWRGDVTRPIVDNLGGITAPTLIVWGRQDGVVPVSHSQVAAKGIPGARLRIFDHCGHIPPLERTEEFSALVLEFLAA